MGALLARGEILFRAVPPQEGKTIVKPLAIVVVACDGGRVVGASTASPLTGHAAAFAAPFRNAGYDATRIYYFGESVLLPAYRGRGPGHVFFDQREAQARAQGRFDIATFCAVRRDPEDPRMPAGYRPLDAFWAGRGFAKAEGLATSFDWKEVGAPGDVSHHMQFWVKRL